MQDPIAPFLEPDGDTADRPADVGGTSALILAWIAIGFAIVSIPGALAWVPWLKADVGILILLSDLTPFTATLSWGFAVAGAIVGLVGVVRHGRRGRSRVGLALAAPGAILGTVAMAMAVVFIVNVFGLNPDNPAQDRATAIVNSYTSRSGSIICDNGDGGHGPDNLTPWYTAYIDVPANLATESQARAALAAAGFHSAELGDAHDDYGGTGGQGSFALHTGNAKRSAGVSVYPYGDVKLFCTNHGVKYGQSHESPSGRSVIEVEVSLQSSR